MNKLELIATVLNTDLKTPEMTDQERKDKISEGLKGFAADMFNLSQMLRERNLDAEAAREIMEQQGMEYSGKTKKYS